MVEYFTLFKALHIIAVICWMAGMFYLPRLYMYHADVKFGSDTDKLLQIMERRLFKIIITPSMIVTIVFGLIVANYFGFEGLGRWFHLKMLLVIIFVIMHGMMAKWRRDFENGKNTRSAKFYRVFNELIPIIMVLIVLLVVLKPFED